MGERLMQISVFYDHITQARQQTGRSLSQLLKACRGWGILKKYLSERVT